jgi:2-desacetyl-2-hydroxyethyl bacteriochlorophyllide A dehydrogenase
MKSIVLEQPGRFMLQQKEYPRLLSDDHVLVKVHKIGVCGTDLHAYTGKQPFFSYPRILGHELAVEVIETGANVTNVKKGDFCCVEPYRNPTIGQAVLRGKTNCGENLTVLGVHEDGGMQEYFTYFGSHLHPFKKLSLDQMALIEPLAIGRHAVNRADIKPDDIVLVVGAGPIGLCVTEFAKLTGARVLVMDVNADRISFCSAQLGINDVLLANDSPLDQLQNYLHGYLPTIVLDATGNKESMHNAFHFVAAGGTIVFVGLFTGDISFSDPFFHKKELTLKASRAALSKDFKEIGQLMEDGIIHPDWMITHRLGFDEVINQFETLTNPENKVIKAIIEL